MTGLIRKATLLMACGVILGATSASAGVPSPANTWGVLSASQKRINLGPVLTAVTLADTFTTKTVLTFTVRDLANNPISGSSVFIDFNGCNGSRVCDSQIYQGMVTTPGPVVRGLSNALGVVSLVVTGGYNGSVPAAADARNCASIYADGVLLGTLDVGAYDLNGGGGVDGTDLSLWAADAFDIGAPNASRSDYDGSGIVDGADLSELAVSLFEVSGTSSCATAYWP